MATTNKSAFFWSCPKCGQTLETHVRATEVVCNNPEAHSSTPIRMVEISRARKAS